MSAPSGQELGQELLKEIRSMEADEAKIKAFIAAGADLTARCGRNGWAPLHMAVSAHNAAAISAIIVAKGDPDIRDNGGETPLQTACWMGDFESARLLVEAGANVNSIRSDGATPLHLASFADAPAIMRLLLDNGASLEARDSEGRTPLEDAHAFGKGAAVVGVLAEAEKRRAGERRETASRAEQAQAESRAFGDYLEAGLPLIADTKVPRPLRLRAPKLSL